MNEIIIFCASYLFIFVIAILVLAWFKLASDKKVKFISAVVVAGIIAFIMARIGSKLFYDPRPFVREHVKPLIPHAPDNGFPSDHALLTGTLTAITYFYSKKYASIMLVFTIFVGSARVLAKVHSPLDIAAGWTFGVIGSIASFYLIEWFFNTPKGQRFNAIIYELISKNKLLKALF